MSALAVVQPAFPPGRPVPASLVAEDLGCLPYVDEVIGGTRTITTTHLPANMKALHIFQYGHLVAVVKLAGSGEDAQ